MKEKQIDKNERNFVPTINSMATQVLRKEGNSRFVEISNSMFDKERVMTNFVVYDTTKTKGNRIVEKITIYLDFERALLFCQNILDGTYKKKVAEAYIARLRPLGSQLAGLAKQAEAVGKVDEAKKYNKLIEKCKAAVNLKDVDDLELLYKEITAMPNVKPVQVATEPLFLEMGGTSADKLKARDMARADGGAESRQFKLMLGSKKRYLLAAESGPGKQNDKGLIVPTYKGKPEHNILVGMNEDEIKGFALKLKMHIESFTTAKYTKTLLNQLEEFIGRLLETFTMPSKGGNSYTSTKVNEDMVVSAKSEEMPEEKAPKKLNEPTDAEIDKYLETATDDLPF